MSQDHDRLVEIPCDNWVELREMYNRDWPNHIVNYYTIDTYIRWKEQCDTIANLHFYSLNGEWRRDGTVLIVVKISCFLTYTL